MKIVPMEECHIAGISEVERQCFCEPWSPDALREELGRGIFRASNAAAIALYEKYGFEPVGTRRGFYRQPVEDALLMTRRLR